MRIASLGNVERREEGNGSAWHTACFNQTLHSLPYSCAKSHGTRRCGGLLLPRGTRHCSHNHPSWLQHTCTRAGTGELHTGTAKHQALGVLPPSRRPRGGMCWHWTRCETVHGAAIPLSCQNPFLPTGCCAPARCTRYQAVTDVPNNRLIIGLSR